MRDAVVLEGVEAWDAVAELVEGECVDVVNGTVVDVVEAAFVDVVVGTAVGVVDDTLAPAPAQPATINEVTAAPTRERAAYHRCSSTRTHGSERIDAKRSKLGMMAS
ncbi:MAG: hypothetical protein ABI899_12180 [Actinomycetota bacterium]